jgi:DNA-binding response OmpR family regulator
MLTHDPTLVLLVDRDADTRQMYAEYLRAMHYATDQAEDGRTALAKVLTSQPEVLVTETRLPGINGYDLCHVLRDDRDVRDMRIIFLTGDAFASDVARAEANGADAVLVKPCLPDVLAQTIRRLFTRTAELRERAGRTVAKAAFDVQQARQTIETTRVTRAMLSRSHRRGDTTTPPKPIPSLRCVQCDAPLKYVKSFVGGVSIKHQEQWDYFECVNGCGTFQYRQRTRSVRRIA